MLSSPVFALRVISVEGVDRVAESWVRDRIDEQRGTNLLRLDLGEVKGRLLRHQWVRAVELHKHLPDRLRIRLLEHEPEALLRVVTGLYYLDPEGSVIAHAVEEPIGWLVIGDPHAELNTNGGKPIESARAIHHRRRALGLARLFASGSIPWWIGPLEAIEILGDEDFRLEVESLPYALLVRPGTVGARLQLLDRLLPELSLELAAAELVDLRFSGRIVLRQDAASLSPSTATEGNRNG